MIPRGARTGGNRSREKDGRKRWTVVDDELEKYRAVTVRNASIGDGRKGNSCGSKKKRGEREER